ncbi:MAG: peptide deformylase [Candidatus Wildermuthbacteria bacterium]|nr:peptide deformylase [Candidatus Wildermuthbacteria bacterium]
MANPLTIVKYPQPVLLKKAKPVESVTKDIVHLIPQMEKIMEFHEGIGLAAPQVGDSRQIIIVKGNTQNHAFLNPAILKKSKKQISDEEGCLSLPDIFLKIKRSEEVEVFAQTPKGKAVRIVAKGLAARIFQHEIDHLQGILIIHRANPLKRIWDSLKIYKNKGY